MSGIKFNSTGLMAGLSTMPTKMDVMVKMFAETSALGMQNDAREQARWTDRTGDARKRIKGAVFKTNKGFRIELAHGVDYGLWLELANEKKYAIVEPIVRMSSPYIMCDFEGMMNKIK